MQKKNKANFWKLFSKHRKDLAFINTLHESNKIIKENPSTPTLQQQIIKISKKIK